MSLVSLAGGPFLTLEGSTVIDSPPGGNGDGWFYPGEDGQVVVSLYNAGNQAATGVTAKLRSGYDQFVITDSTASLGTIAAGASCSNNTDRFAASADSAIPPGTAVPCSLILHSPGWSYDRTMVFTLPVGLAPIPGQFYVTLDTGAVALSVCGIGSIGRTDLNGQGSGFQVPRGTNNCLYYASMLAGNSEDYVVDHFYDTNDETDKDWVMVDSLRFVAPAVPADEQWVNKMTDAGHPSPRELTVEQRWYMNDDQGYDDFAIGIYDFYNLGSAPILGFHVAMVGDFDIGSQPRSNMVYSDTVRRSVFMRQSGAENPTAGFVILEPRQFANLTAIDHSLYVYPDSAMTDGMKWRHIDGTISLPQPNRAYDWSCLASAGPFNLGIGDNMRVAFAVVGATSQASFEAAVDSAQSWYDSHFTGIGEEKQPLVAAVQRPLLLSPNPFSRGTMVQYYCPVAGPVELRAYDASGRQVERVMLGAGKGSCQYFWQPKELVSGVYFLKVGTPECESAAKVLLLD